MQIIDGKATAAAIRAEIASSVAQIVDAGGRAPHLAAILVGHDGGSESYVASKVKACEECGFGSTLLRFEGSISQEQLLEHIRDLNNNPDIDGFIVQLPLPRHIDTHAVIEAIDPRKDVDGFHPANVGRLSIGLPGFVSATPAGIIELLQRYQIPTSGKHCVILGRSNIVGKPLAMLMMQKSYPGDATVTVCHSRTADIASITRTADILVAAMGVPASVTADMVKEGATVIDVGTTRVPDATRARGWKLCGDVDYESAEAVAGYLTPVPGGVGPMTIAMLMRNTLLAATGAVYPKQ